MSASFVLRSLKFPRVAECVHWFVATKQGVARAKHVLSLVEGTPRTPSPEVVNLLCGPFDCAQDMLCAFARDIPSLVAALPRFALLLSQNGLK
jgi:hypothetical protein